MNILYENDILEKKKKKECQHTRRPSLAWGAASLADRGAAAVAGAAAIAMILYI